MNLIDSSTARYVGLMSTAVLVYMVIGFLTLLLGKPWWISIFVWFGVVGVFFGVLALVKGKKQRLPKGWARIGAAVLSMAAIGLAGWGFAMFNMTWWVATLFAMGIIGLLLLTGKNIIRNKGGRKSVVILAACVIVAISGFLTSSFIKNLFILREASILLSNPVLLGAGLKSDVLALSRLRHTIQEIDEKNRKFWHARFGLDASLILEGKMKQAYKAHIEDRFLNRVDLQITEEASAFTTSTPDERIAACTLFLTRRINILRETLAGKGVEALKKLPQPGFQAFLINDFSDTTPKIYELVQSLYLYYEAWTPDSTERHKEMNELQSLLKYILERNNSLYWLVGRINRDFPDAKIQLKDFWPPGVEVASEIVIDPAFTLDGKNAIDSIIEEVGQALYNPLTIAQVKDEFQQRYRRAYFFAWEKFVEAFPGSRTVLKDKTGWLSVVAMMAEDRGPYFSLLKTMARELEPMVHHHETGVPSWLRQTMALSRFGLLTDGKSAQASNTGIIRKATMKVRSRLAPLPPLPGKKMDDESIKAASDAIDAYRSASTRLRVALGSPASSFKITSQVFEQGPVVENPVVDAYNAIDRMKRALAQDEQEEIHIWRLLQDPIDHLFTLASKETACFLQEKWEKDVLLEVQGLSTRDINQLLFEPHGLVTRFLKSDLAPFITRRLKKGYLPQTALGQEIPFKREFLKFMNKGANIIQPSDKSFTFYVQGIPTEVNAGAKSEPYVTVVEFQCDRGDQKLKISNISDGSTLKWSSRSCDQVELFVGIAGLILSKTYDGKSAISDFLNDFKTGHKAFTPSDFPMQKTKLEVLNISEITVNFRFKGHQPVVDFYKKGNFAAPSKAPRSIVACWK